MENMTNTLGGFEAIFDSFIPKTEEETDLNNAEEQFEDFDDDEKREKIKDPVIERMKKEKKIDTTEEEEIEEENKEAEEEDKVEVKQNNKTKKNEENFVDETSENEDNEATIVEGFFGAIAEKLGWSFDEDEETPKDIDSLIDYFSDIIEKQSKPEYASEEIEALDNFVKLGGDIRSYFNIEGELDLDKIDLEDENNQKRVVRELLKEKGFSSTRIEKMINKYEDAGILEDEAEDAVEDLKEIKQQQKEKLLLDQEKQYNDYKQVQQQLYNNVVNEIKGLKNIRGIAIPEKDKKVLIEYILKPDADGKTKYQKDYAKGGVKNLIESAYFTMNADKLIEAAKKEGNNSAIEKFKNSLRNTSVGGKSKQAIRTSDNDTIWDNFTRKLRITR